MKKISSFVSLFVLFISLILAAESSLARVMIRDCQKQPVATQNIQKAISFIATHVERILNHPDLRGLTQAERNRYKRVLFNEDFPIVCRPSNSKYCIQNGNPINGYAHEIDRYTEQRGQESRGIYLCNSERSNYLGCNFYASIAHEIAHLAEIRKAPNHDVLGKGVNRSGDLIYILDDVVFRLCSVRK